MGMNERAAHIIYFMDLFKHDSTITRQIVNGNSIGNKWAERKYKAKMTK